MFGVSEQYYSGRHPEVIDFINGMIVYVLALREDSGSSLIQPGVWRSDLAALLVGQEEAPHLPRMCQAPRNKFFLSWAGLRMACPATNKNLACREDNTTVASEGPISIPESIPYSRSNSGRDRRASFS